MNTAERYRGARCTLGLTQQQVARAASARQEEVSRLETGLADRVQGALTAGLRDRITESLAAGALDAAAADALLHHPQGAR